MKTITSEVPEGTMGFDAIGLQLLESLKNKIMSCNPASLNFQGATINISFNGQMSRCGTENYQGYKEPKALDKKITDEQLARALMAINGKGKAIDSQRAWLGACGLLSWKYGFPRNLGDCCKRIDALPLDIESMEFLCKYESIRMYGSWKFLKEDYKDWPTYVPRDDERAVFEKSLSVAQALDEEIQKQIELEA